MDQGTIIFIIVVSAILVYPLIVRPIMNLAQVAKDMKKLTLGLAIEVQLLADILKKLEETQSTEKDDE